MKQLKRKLLKRSKGPAKRTSSEAAIDVRIFCYVGVIIKIDEIALAYVFEGNKDGRGQYKTNKKHIFFFEFLLSFAHIPVPLNDRYSKLSYGLQI